jgi:hypothetical protein
MKYFLGSFLRIAYTSSSNNHFSKHEEETIFETTSLNTPEHSLCQSSGYTELARHLMWEGLTRKYVGGINGEYTSPRILIPIETRK